MGDPLFPIAMHGALSPCGGCDTVGVSRVRRAPLVRSRGRIYYAVKDGGDLAIVPIRAVTLRATRSVTAPIGTIAPR